MSVDSFVDGYKTLDPVKVVVVVKKRLSKTTVEVTVEEVNTKRIVIVDKDFAVVGDGYSYYY